MAATARPMAEMRVVCVCGYYAPATAYGGPVRSLRGLTRGLAANGVHVTVLTTDANGTDSVDVPPRRVDDGVEILTSHRLGASIRGLRTYFASFGLAKNAFEAIRHADLVHVEGAWMFSTAIGSFAAQLLSKPYVVMPRGTFEHWSLQQKQLKKAAYLWAIERRNLQRASGIVYTAKNEQEQAPAWLKQVPGFIVPNGFDFGPLHERGSLRHRLGVDLDTRLFGLAGRLHPKKGYDILLPALRALPTDAKWLLLLAGTDSDRYWPRLENDIANLGLTERIRYLGFLGGNDLDEFYSGIDVLLMPSHAENFGNVMAEALAQGTPVAVSRAICLADWVEERGVGVALPLASDRWTEFLTRICTGGRTVDRTTEELANVARSEFDYRNVGRRMVGVYEAAIQRGRGGRA